MVSKIVNEHIVSVEWSDVEDRYRVYVDSDFIGGANTTEDATIVASDYLEKLERKKRALFVKLDDGAFEPVRAHPTDAGLDLKSPTSFWLHPGKHQFVDTGVHCDIPSGYVGLLTSKSGLMKKGITTRGTIDSGYTGSIGVVMYNHGNEGILVEEGDKITQLVIIPCITPAIEIVDELRDTERADGGFGSTGKK